MLWLSDIENTFDSQYFRPLYWNSNVHDKHKIQFLSLKKVNIFLESVHVRRATLKSDFESFTIPLAPKILKWGDFWTVQPTIKNSNFQSDRKLNLLVTIYFYSLHTTFNNHLHRSINMLPYFQIWHQNLRRKNWKPIQWKLVQNWLMKKYLPVSIQGKLKLLMEKILQ